MLTKKYLNWEDINFKWEDLDMLWEDISILIEVGRVIGGSGGYSEYVKNNPWDVTKRKLGEEKTDKFIKIFCRVNNLKYENMKLSKKNVKITVEQITKVFNEGIKIGINFDIKN